MTKREIIKLVLDGKKPPYVPWSFKFTKEPYEMLQLHFGVDDLDEAVGNHILQLGSDIGFFDDLGNDQFQDVSFAGRDLYSRPCSRKFKI